MIIIAIFSVVLLLSMDPNARDSSHMGGIHCILTLSQCQMCLRRLLLLKKITGNRKWNF